MNFNDGPRPPSMNVVVAFQLSDEASRSIRQLAAVRGINLSAAISLAIRNAIDIVDFPPIPHGGEVRMKRRAMYRQARYFIPVALAQKLIDIQSLGYSGPFVSEVLIRKGLELERRPRKNPQASEILSGSALEEGESGRFEFVDPPSEAEDGSVQPDQT